VYTLSLHDALPICSKGLPRKNILKLNGKPLIAHTIEAAKRAEVFEKVVVSTDDSEIAEVSLVYGAEVPFMRPTNLSGDTIPSDDVILHAIEFFEEKGMDFDCVCKLQPTSPLRTAAHIKESYMQFLKENANYMVSVCLCEHTPLWSLTLDEKGHLDQFIKGAQSKVYRQAFLDYYRLNGALYYAKVKEFLQCPNFCSDGFLAYIMDTKYSIDIDSEWDFKLAEIIAQLLDA
jgi:CMP-N-acetylneuraminic acid synthetase